MTQPKPMSRHGDHHEYCDENQIGVAPIERGVEDGSEGREDGAGKAGHQCEGGESGDAVLAAPMGERGERRRIKNARHG